MALSTFSDLIATVRNTLQAHPEVIAATTEANATITVDGGEWTLVGDNYELGSSAALEAFLKPDKPPMGIDLEGVQPQDQYYSGRLIEPKTFVVTPKPGQVNPATIDEMEGEWRWAIADEGAFKLEDLIGTPISGYFRRT